MATDGANASGIGGGPTGTTGNIVLSGGVITASGHIKTDGYDIGAFKDKGYTIFADIEIGDTTIQARSVGEGKYNTTGAKGMVTVPGGGSAVQQV